MSYWDEASGRWLPYHPALYTMSNATQNDFIRNQQPHHPGTYQGPAMGPAMFRAMRPAPRPPFQHTAQVQGHHPVNNQSLRIPPGLDRRTTRRITLASLEASRIRRASRSPSQNGTSTPLVQDAISQTSRITNGTSRPPSRNGTRTPHVQEALSQTSRITNGTSRPQSRNGTRTPPVQSSSQQNIMNNQRPTRVNGTVPTSQNDTNTAHTQNHSQPLSTANNVQPNNTVAPTSAVETTVNRTAMTTPLYARLRDDTGFFYPQYLPNLEDVRTIPSSANGNSAHTHTTIPPYPRGHQNVNGIRPLR